MLLALAKITLVIPHMHVCYVSLWYWLLTYGSTVYTHNAHVWMHPSRIFATSWLFNYIHVFTILCTMVDVYAYRHIVYTLHIVHESHCRQTSFRVGTRDKCKPSVSWGLWPNKYMDFPTQKHTWFSWYYSSP